MQYILSFTLVLLLAATASAEKPDKVPRNLRVLNQLSKPELTRTMNFMRASLGVHCDFCHVVGKDGWKFDSDEKPQKHKARQMINMVQAINRDHFQGSPVVSCFTCHQGRQRPEGAPPLPQKDPLFPTIIADPGTIDVPAQLILDQYHEATGGVEARSALTGAQTIVMKGTTDDTWKHKSVRYEVYYKAPDRWLTRRYLDSGVLTEVMNGDSGWSHDGKSATEMSHSEKAFFRETIASLQWFPEPQSAEAPLVRKARVADRDAFVLEYKNKTGGSEQFFFDAQSHFLVRRTRFTPSLAGMVPEEFLYEDYKKVQGVSVPFILRSHGVDSWSSGARSFTEILVNAPVEDSMFEIPATTAADVQ